MSILSAGVPRRHAPFGRLRRQRGQRRARRGFTLAELMLVLVMISVLSSMAVAGFKGVKDAAYRSDLTAAVAAFRTAEELYVDRYGEFAVDWTDLELKLSPGIVVLDYVSPTPNYWSVLLRHSQGRARCTGAYEQAVTCFRTDDAFDAP